MIIPLAVSVHSVLAWAFASTSRPWWHESIWAPQFVVAALYSGVALVILVVAGFRRGYHLEGSSPSGTLSAWGSSWRRSPPPTST